MLEVVRRAPGLVRGAGVVRRYRRHERAYLLHSAGLRELRLGGALFRCAYSSTPTCTPARSAILTGLSPWHHGMLGMTNMAHRYPLEKPQALRDAGAPDDPRVGPSATFDWMSGVHERQLQQLARRSERDRTPG